jgi:hypothetical protein
MQRGDQDRINQLLVNPDHINLDDLLRDGRIGLYVVSVIARQHGIVVQLQTNIYGGTQAIVILPQPLLDSPTTTEHLQPAVRPESLSELTTEIPQQSAWPVSPPPAAPVPVARPLAVNGNNYAVPAAGPSAGLDRPSNLPPLPRRRSQSHMVPQLQLGPPAPAPEPTGEHNPGLMASFMHGVSQGEADPAGPDRL